MLDIPFEENRGDACALSCYTMTARYFLPETTFDEIAKISDWRRGYVIWGFKFWLWIMDRGIEVIDYDLIDLEKWADNGVESLKSEMSEQEYNFIVKKTYQINSYGEDIKKILVHPNFTYKRQRPTWNDLLEAFSKDYVCEVVLDSTTLDGKRGDVSLHRVVVLDITPEEITFHDPRTNKLRPARKEKIELFKKAWLDALKGPELCIYKHVSN